jgi:hypothetical protein
LLVQAPATRVVDAVTGEFSVGVTFVQHISTSGYLFAKSLSDDSKRFFGLYSRSGRLVLFYEPVDPSMPRQSVEFDTAVATGEMTRLLLSFTATSVTLRLDGDVVQTQPLVSAVDDCDSSVPECVLFVGARSSGGSSSLHVLSGAVENVLLYQSVALGFDPTLVLPTFDTSGAAFTVDTAGRSYLDLLTSANLDRDPSTSLSSANVVGFDGNGVATVDSAAAGALLGPDMAVTLVARVTVNATGYLLANADPAGISRYLGLYFDGVAVRWYYRAAGALRPVLRFTLASRLDDGAFHQIIFQVNSTHATLVVDSVVYTHTLAAGFAPIACPAGCRVVLGGRPAPSPLDSAFRLVGAIAVARVYPFASTVALDAFPSDLEWRFFRTADTFMRFENDLGAFPTGIPEDECRRRCMSLPQCRSLDVGVAGTIREGACYFSSETLDTRPAARQPSVLYNYFQRIE